MAADEMIENLTEGECRELLHSASVGRVGITIGALPAIVPVEYVYVDGDVIFRVGQDAKLRAALHESVVAFEVDRVDRGDRGDGRRHGGWSVLAVGTAREVTDPEEVAELDRTDLGDGQREFVRLHPVFLSGRRLAGRPGLPGPVGAAAH